MADKQLAQVNESPHYLDTRPNCHWTLEDVGNHYSTVLGDDERTIFHVPATFQDHRL